MKAEDIVKIHLPNGKTYEIVQNTDVSNIMTENDINTLMNFMGTAHQVHITVLPDKANGLMKEMVLVLWGDTLKNSYVTISRYSGT